MRRARFDSILKYGLYPVLLALTSGYVTFELAGANPVPGRHYGFYLGGVLSIMLALEALHPMRREWSMTWGTLLRRDLPYLAINAATIAAAGVFVNELLRRFAIDRGEQFLTLPLVPSVILILVIPEFFWYWVHRWSHEARGRMGRWLWRVHLPHHMPRQLYAVMHVVAHPLNTIVVRLILSAPLYVLGFSAESLFVANAIVGLQGIVSHYNVEMRAGWLNYVLVGNELHRYHHSANVEEARNFGNIVPIWDIVFGTFVYRPGIAPAALGLADPDAYPSESDLLRVLALPFRNSRTSPINDAEAFVAEQRIENADRRAMW